MCGIVGYIGNKNSVPIIKKGLEKLEYRGYDSAGIAFINSSKTHIYKKAGQVDVLKNYIKDYKLESNIGIGHTRWATHGVVSDVNSHPHASNDNSISLIHNGIIENYKEIKQYLQEKKYIFRSNTDTEVLVNLIHYNHKKHNANLYEATRESLKKVKGTYAILVISNKEQNKIIAARNKSPLAIGISENEKYIGSDITPIVEYTNRFVFLENNNIAIIEAEKIQIKDLNDNIIDVIEQKIHTNYKSIYKGTYKHHMIKEIHEQTETTKQLIDTRVKKKKIHFNELNLIKKDIINANRIILLGCGGSLHSAMYAKYVIEELCSIPIAVENASEFRYRSPSINKRDIVIGISQSGETADTLNALELAKKYQILTLSITNVPNSSITRLVNTSIITDTGIEISVASTKTFISQLQTFLMLALWISNERNQSNIQEQELVLNELNRIPDNINNILSLKSDIYKISKFISSYKSMYYLGRGVNYPISLEGALKLKEIGYIHAEGYCASEMKHGPIALIDNTFPVFYISTDDDLLSKNKSSIHEIKSRKGVIISLVSKKELDIEEVSEITLQIPNTHRLLQPILNTIPMQIIAYQVGLIKGYDIDKPRNLAKSVTVE